MRTNCPHFGPTARKGQARETWPRNLGSSPLLLCFTPGYSRCDSEASNICDTGDLVRNAGSWPQLRAQNRNLHFDKILG